MTNKEALSKLTNEELAKKISESPCLFCFKTNSCGNKRSAIGLYWCEDAIEKYLGEEVKS